MARKTDTKMAATIREIATTHLHLETLETRKMDDLDFHDLAVWEIRRALGAAYAAGRASNATTTEKE